MAEKIEEESWRICNFAVLAQSLNLGSANPNKLNISLVVPVIEIDPEQPCGATCRGPIRYIDPSDAASHLSGDLNPKLEAVDTINCEAQRKKHRCPEAIDIEPSEDAIPLKTIVQALNK